MRNVITTMGKKTQTLIFESNNNSAIIYVFQRFFGFVFCFFFGKYSIQPK